MVAKIMLPGLLALAAVTDVRQHKIYNWTTYPGMLAALGLNGLGSLLVLLGFVAPEAIEGLGWIGLAASCYGVLACGGLLLVCFVLGGVKGGDVKLIAMMGAFLGPEQGMMAMLWTFVLGACLAVIVLIWRVGFWRLVARVWRQVFWTLRLGSWSPLTPEERAQLKAPLRLAPAALAAVLIVQHSLVEWM